MTEGLEKTIPADDETYEIIARATADPEIRAILLDPVILTLLNECTHNPSASAAHLKNAGVEAAKVQKLIDCGILEA